MIKKDESSSPFNAMVSKTLLPGDHVKIGFSVNAPHTHPLIFDEDGFPWLFGNDYGFQEWMWIEILKVKGKSLEGRLVNYPIWISPDQIKFGDTVKCKLQHINSVNYVSPLREKSRKGRKVSFPNL